jgi:FkbM family methyltransferase
VHLPFKKTLLQTRYRGTKRTVALLLSVLLEQVMRRTGRRLPKETVIEVNNSKMIVFPTKGSIHKDLFLHKKREPLCTDYLLRANVIKKGDVVLDIGANIGYYALAEARLVGEKGQVYAVEPVASNLELLNKNIQLNKLKNVPTFKYAFGDKNERAEIFVSDKSNLCAVSKDAVGGNIVGVQPVTMMTIDEFVKDKKAPKLIRMDVEGYEYEILKGMSSTLKGDIKILMELHPSPKFLGPKKLDELYQTLEQNNFKAKFVVFENKVIENWLFEFFYRESGEKLPIIASNISLDELKRLVETNQKFACPNILFEKQK